MPPATVRGRMVGTRVPHACRSSAQRRGSGDGQTVFPVVLPVVFDGQRCAREHLVGPGHIGTRSAQFVLLQQIRSGSDPARDRAQARRQLTGGEDEPYAGAQDGRGTTHARASPRSTQRLHRRDTCRVDRRRPHTGDPARPAPELPVARARRTATGAGPEPPEHGYPMGCAPGRNRGAPLRAPRTAAAGVARGTRAFPEDHLDPAHDADHGQGGDRVRARGLHPSRGAAGSEMPRRSRG